MREEKYDITGMHCAACSASVERVTRKLPGVDRSDVNLTTGIMTIAYDEAQVTPEQIIAKEALVPRFTPNIKKSPPRISKTPKQRNCAGKNMN